MVLEICSDRPDQIQNPDFADFWNLRLSRPMPLIKGLAVEAVNQAAVNRSVSPGFNALMRVLAYQAIYDRQATVFPYGRERLLSDEEAARHNFFLPTIGVELELPTEGLFKPVQTELYQSLKQIGINGDKEDCDWEFQLPYSYSWKTQMFLLKALVEMGYVPFYQLNIRSVPDRYFCNQSGFSLHCNLGIPRGINLRSSSWVVPDFAEDVRMFAVASGLAFSSADRLCSRKTNFCSTIDKVGYGSLKSTERMSHGRIELRAQGFGNDYSYQQLAIIQEVGAALFSHYRSVVGGDEYTKISQARIGKVWLNLKDQLTSLLTDKYHITDIFDEEDGQLEKVLKETAVQFETRKLLYGARNQVTTEMRRSIPKLTNHIFSFLLELQNSFRS